MLRSIDYSGLIYPIDTQAVSQFRANRRGLFSYSQLGTAAKVALVAVVAVLFLAIVGTQMIGALASVVSSVISEGALVAAIPVLLFFVVMVAVAGGAIYAGVRAWRHNGGPWQRFHRMNKFAEDNGLTPLPPSTTAITATSPAPARTAEPTIRVSWHSNLTAPSPHGVGCSRQ
ncbi:hypothetical protein [Rhodoglobus aureus]|uniref:Uncharacterized protein n=1 Tax=Rhodoglobus aureus TaxID=191497 RepID=A0ABN1VU46_9MICO